MTEVNDPARFTASNDNRAGPEWPPIEPRAVEPPSRSGGRGLPLVYITRLAIEAYDQGIKLTLNLEHLHGIPRRQMVFPLVF